MIPGEVVFAQGTVPFALRGTVTMTVENRGDRPVQVGSHFHFAEANQALFFDRETAYGRRLAVPAGTSVRFEPGIAIEVTLTAFGGNRVAAGFAGKVMGPLDA